MRVRAEVVREIPCAPFYVPVTSFEIEYLGLADVHGFIGSVETDAEIEAGLMGIEEAYHVKTATLDRTWLVARYLDGPKANALADVKIDLSLTEDE
jgi:hypothetical protein